MPTRRGPVTGGRGSAARLEAGEEAAALGAVAAVVRHGAAVAGVAAVASEVAVDSVEVEAEGLAGSQ